MNDRGQLICYMKLIYFHIQPDGFTMRSQFPTPAAGWTHSYALSHTTIGPFLHPGIPLRLCMPSLVCTTCSLFTFTSTCPPGHIPPRASHPHPRPYYAPPFICVNMHHCSFTSPLVHSRSYTWCPRRCHLGRVSSSSTRSFRMHKQTPVVLAHYLEASV